ncbi:transporter [Pseudomonas aeruginosa]
MKIRNKLVGGGKASNGLDLAIAVGALVIAAMAYPKFAFATVLGSDPGDFVALPEETHLGLLYLQHAERKSLMANDRSVPNAPNLVSDIGVARYVYYTTLGGYLISPEIVAPFGSLRLNGSVDDSAAGAGDPVIGSALWLVNQPNERYFALAGYVGVPVGNYDKDEALNLGENRWRGIAQANYTERLYGNLWGEATLEYVTYGDNKDYLGDSTLEQKDTYELHTHLRYQWTPATSTSVSWYHLEGGETKVDGVSQDNRLKTDRYALSLGHFVTPQTQLMVQYGQDFNVENGFKEQSRVNFRIAHVF